MRINQTTWMLAAAGLVVSTAMMDGQTMLTADIPFAFRTAGGVQPAGHYALSLVSLQGNIIKFQDLNTGRSTLVATGSRDEDTRDTHSRLVFRCADQSGCALAGIWIGEGR